MAIVCSRHANLTLVDVTSCLVDVMRPRPASEYRGRPLFCVAIEKIAVDSTNPTANTAPHIMFSVDPALFTDGSISAETREINQSILDKLATEPDQWAMPIAELRARRARGEGPFPLPPKSPRAIDEEINGDYNSVNVRIIAPEKPTGVYLHLHGGGFVLGTADQQDARMEMLVENCGLATVSVDYRLAPEHPHPAAPDDSERAALWLIENSKKRFGTDRLLIGGESAGAHLAVVTMLRLRDKYGLNSFCGANLNSGWYDLGLTPSVRRWGDQKLVLNTRDLNIFLKYFVPENFSVTDPDISPLYADLTSLPPALFTTGTRDPLLDDSLFMASRWQASGNPSELAVYPGGAHVFVSFAGKLAEEGRTRIETFLNQCK